MGFNKRLISQADGISIGPRVTSISNRTLIYTVPNLGQNGYGRGIAFYNNTIYAHEAWVDSGGNTNHYIVKRNTSGGQIAAYAISSATIGGVPYLGGADGIFVDNSGNIYIGDEKDSRPDAYLRKYNNSGVYQSEFVVVSNFYMTGPAYDKDRNLFHHGRHSSSTIYIKNLSNSTQSTYTTSTANYYASFYAENQMFHVAYNGSNWVAYPYDLELNSAGTPITLPGAINTYSAGYDSSNQYLYGFDNRFCYRYDVTVA